ncbi:hypothetical protein TNCV_1108501 [Trichonephila clavipes]|nr:hypothetical protein TNCV_1108501 [Trichonephila clavipes]
MQRIVLQSAPPQHCFESSIPRVQETGESPMGAVLFSFGDMDRAAFPLRLTRHVHRAQKIWGCKKLEGEKGEKEISVNTHSTI